MCRIHFFSIFSFKYSTAFWTFSSFQLFHKQTEIGNNLTHCSSKKFLLVLSVFFLSLNITYRVVILMDEIEFQVVIEVLWYLPNLLQLYCIQNHHCPPLEELKTSLTLSLFFHLSSHNRQSFFHIFQESGGNCKGRMYGEQKGHIISTSPLMPNCRKGGLFCSYLYLINFAII